MLHYLICESDLPVRYTSWKPHFCPQLYFLVKILTDLLAVSINSTHLWIVGGHNPNVEDLKSTEFITKDRILRSSFVLPTTWSYGCAVKLQGKIYIIGGLRNGPQKTTNKMWIVDPSKGFEFKEGPAMTHERYGQSCSSMAGRYIVVAGGAEARKSVEIFDLLTNSWTTGKTNANIFLNFSVDFLISIIFSNMNYNCSN